MFCKGDYMRNKVQFRFYGNLNDFLSSDSSESYIDYTYDEAPSVKDAIEALGVPHPEVHTILVNNTPADFGYMLRSGDKFDVYPVADGAFGFQPNELRFVLDVHLGKLAKALRMLGFDTLYENSYTDKLMADLALSEKRIVLTRDVGLLKHKVITYGYWLRSQHLEEQLAEVINYFYLKDHFRPLTRCLVCNTTIVQVEKASVYEQLPPKTKLYYHEFYQCPLCKRVYWKGSHYERMEAFINHLSNK